MLPPHLPHLPRRIAMLLAAAALLGAASSQVCAGDYPDRPVKIIVPFTPGGGSDFIARFIAMRLQAVMGQPFVVDNRPGAGGLLGTELGVKAPADGYTLTLIASSYTVNPALYALKFDPVADIAPVVQLSQGPMLVVANPSFAAKTMPELIALARAKPGTINFASAGTGSITHMAAEYFAMQAGVKMNHIPYKGTGPALTDTIGGQVDVFFASTATSLPLVKGGKLTALAVTTALRLPGEPKVPTIAESGVPGYDVPVWHGLIAPKGTPQAIIDKLNLEVRKLLKLGETGAELAKDGVHPAGDTPAAFHDRIRAEIAMWKKVARDGNIKVE